MDRKERFGNLKADTIIGKKYKGTIVTINDRMTGMLKMKKVSGKEAAPVAEAIIYLPEEWKPLTHTITSDNGKEFANHRAIAEELNVGFYFAKPYHFWQRGANENLNGLIRQSLKQTDFTKISDDQLTSIENKLNNRSGKKFRYKSSDQVFAATLDNHTKLVLILI